MARQIRWGLALVIAFGALGAGTALASAPAQTEQPQPTARAPKEQGSKQGHERRVWWKDDRFRAEVGFTPEQAAEIDDIFRTTMAKARLLRAEVDELDKSIEKMIVAHDSDLAVFTHTVEKVEARRAELNKMRTVMLYRIRRVFTPEQNAKFHAAYERWEAARKRPDGNRRK